jgi:serine/threonine protein kinase
MTAKPLLCQPDRILAFLQSTLSADERATFEEHLDQCEPCRMALDRAVASPEQWGELRLSLAQHDAGSPQPENENDEQPLQNHSVEAYRRLLGPTDDPRMLGRLGPYEIVGVLGRGGMGIVFKGLDPSLNRYVAIKMLAPLISAGAASRQRFLREAQAAAAVVHEHVVAIHGISQWQDAPYLVMEYVRGESLQKRLASRGPLPIRELLRIGMQVAAGLAAAHAQGLIHRDIKPANILLESGVDRVRITDFGLARAVDDIRLTRSDLLLGTPQYMSPEQARDELLDFRTDLFSLGVVLYEAAAGRAPFQAATSYGTLRKIVDHQPTPLRQLNPDLPAWFERIVAQLMAKDPRQRFSTAGEVATLLQQCLAHVEQPYLVRLPAPLNEHQGRETVLFWRIAMSVTLIVTLLSGGWWWTGQVGGGAGRVGPPARSPAAAQKAPDAKESKEATPALPSVTVDKHTISVRKVADVIGMKMDMEFDIGKLALQQQGQGFGNAGGGGFAGGAGGGGGGSFTKPFLGVALTAESSSANDRLIVEISPEATAIDDQDRKLQTANTGPGRIHIQEFEKSVPGSHAIYFGLPSVEATRLKRLDGKLLLTPGRVLVASFVGPNFNGPKTMRAGGESFTLESVKQNANEIEVTAVCPPTKSAAAATNPQERFQAMLASRGVYSAEIEDNTGEIHRTSGGSSGGGGGGQFGFGGAIPGGNPNGQPPAASAPQSFRFAPLPPGRKIQTVRIRMTERTGPSQSLPFTIENIPFTPFFGRLIGVVH